MRPPLLVVPTAMEARLLLGDEPDGPPGTRRIAGRRVLVGLCGVGPVASAAVVGYWLAELRPPALLLAGVAGTYDPERTPVATAITAGSVSLDGVGAGEGDDFTTLPFDQVPAGLAGHAIRDRVELPAHGVDVLSVCAAAANDDEVRRRRMRHPQAAVEEMEGFGIAIAATLAVVPCTIVRGISNVAGQRDPTSWDLEGAAAACRPLIESWLTNGDSAR